MLLNSLPKLTTITNKRLGRGLGSGKGKTSGRGQKGQKARGTIPPSFSGGGLPLYKKLPLNRGWGNPKRSAKPVIIYLESLNVLKPGTVVDLMTLIENKIVSEKEAKKSGVKILDKGTLNVKLTIKLPVSKKALAKIQSSGGDVIV